MENKKHIMKVLGRFVLRVVILSVISLLIAFLITIKMDKNFYQILEYVGLVLFCIGGLTVFGNMSVRQSMHSNLNKFMVGSNRMLNEERELSDNSMIASLYPFLSGVILLMISLIQYFK